MLEDDEEDAWLTTEFDTRVAELESGVDMLLPRDVWAAIRGGANPIAAVRKARGMTQASLATAAGLKQPTVSGLESDIGSGSVASLRAVADALHAPLDVLVGRTQST